MNELGLDRLTLTVAALAVGAAVLIALIASKKDPLRHIPLAGTGSRRARVKQYHHDAKRIYEEACKQFKSLFRVATPEGDYVLVPYDLLDEYNSVPESVFSPHAPFDQFVEKYLTDINITSRALIFSVRQDLTPSLGKITPALSSVAENAVISQLPPCDEWTEVDLHHALISQVTIVSGWVFVGPEYCHTKEYKDLAAAYAADAFGGPKMLQAFPSWLRPLAAPFLPPLRRVKRFHQRILDLLGPGIERRRKQIAENEARSADMLDWLIKNAHRFPHDISSDYDIARVQQSLSAVAIHTTALTAVATLYDLSCEPKIMEDVRSEIGEVLQRNGGQMTSRALYEMKLLDAVCKESQRLNPADLLSARRKVMKPYTFSDGVEVPVGAMLAVPVYTYARDPAQFPQPDTFDPYRFTRLRENGSNDHLQFASVTNGTMAFGCGKHACPGRFFAALEIKLLVIHLLQAFDFKAIPEADGVVRRYRNMEYDSMNMPDVTKKLLFKKRVS
ncbi:ent-kaurene oxidase [Lecanosticta acicola]|uniref:Ent-kaurene oxidase n=1 Tax=Lecanosticta acicola TaxID=111012 RepID=A0AAI8Z964_9PEZI|nr:ent-kaurene oxidase [Lecanosticta acicola]